MASSYIVLRRSASGAYTIEGDPVEADNARQAVRRATEGRDSEERSGAFVAVPARSWQPMTRQVTTVEKDEWA